LPKGVKFRDAEKEMNSFSGPDAGANSHDRCRMFCPDKYQREPQKMTPGHEWFIKSFTFQDSGRKTATQFATFVAISVSCLIVNLGIVWLAVTFLSLAPLVAKVIATCCAFLRNYHGQSRFTFRSGEGT
jgi:putative flippase GtrA